MAFTPWYKEMSVYHIWPRSFCDGNGDGIGDLWGVLSKLDYIKSLNVDAIWFSPLYPSPNADYGYDISDYMNIHPDYGNLDVFRQVLDGAHERGLRVFMDLVVNHSSDEHPWFKESRKSKDSPYHDYYFWRPGRRGGINGKKLLPPNNWTSLFEGGAWEYDSSLDEFYLHLFAKKQPDLNMDNPAVREEVKKILRFWLDMGVDGFREDVITYISKKEGLPDDHLMPTCKGMPHYNHGPHIHEYLNEFKHDVLDHYDCFTLAEAPMVTPKRALTYIDEKNGQLDMMIQFQCVAADCLFTDYLPTKFSLRRMKKAFSSWQEKLRGRGWNSLYIENHDHPRIVSRYGSEEFWAQSAKCLAAMYLFQQGTPFIYQGQEIGMTNWRPERADMYEDVQTRYTYAHTALKQSEEVRLHRLWRSSRDSARTPVQWDDSENAGFTTGKPWFYVNQNYKDINVAQQDADPDSVLNFYRKAVALRKSLSCVRYGEYREYNKLSGRHYLYSMDDGQQKILVVCSFAKKNTPFHAPKGFRPEDGELILCNYPKPLEGCLQPYECRVYLWK